MKNTLLSSIFILLMVTPIKGQGECTKTWTFLYSGPGKYFSERWQVKPNTPLKIIKKKKKWSLVEEFDGIRSWVLNKDMIKDHFCGIVKVPTKGKKSLSSRKTKLIKFGSTVKIIKIKKPYAYIEYEGKNKYWVPQKRLWVY
jgi:uncharacterized protein YgiM (DUF1202 family)